MKKFKDFSHNISDILLAVIIVVIAAGIILWRLNIILDYPERAAKENTHPVQTEEALVDNSDSAADDETASEDSETTDAENAEDAAEEDSEYNEYSEDVVESDGELTDSDQAQG